MQLHGVCVGGVYRFCFLHSAECSGSSSEVCYKAAASSFLAECHPTMRLHQLSTEGPVGCCQLGLTMNEAVVNTSRTWACENVSFLFFLDECQRLHVCFLISCHHLQSRYFVWKSILWFLLINQAMQKDEATRSHDAVPGRNLSPLICHLALLTYFIYLSDGGMGQRERTHTEGF